MSGLHSYSAAGMGQGVLEALEREPCGYSTFRETLGPGRRRKCWYLVQSMRADGLIQRTGPETYELTAEGREALSELRRGRDYYCGITPTVRIFTEARA